MPDTHLLPGLNLEKFLYYDYQSNGVWGTTRNSQTRQNLEIISVSRLDIEKAYRQVTSATRVFPEDAGEEFAINVPIYSNVKISKYTKDLRYFSETV